MPELDTILQFVLPLLLSYLAYLFGRRKDAAEIKKLEIESQNLKLQARKLELDAEQQVLDTEKEEIDIMDRTVDFYKNKMAEMLDEIESLKKQIAELKVLLEGLVLNQCLGDKCPTKIEYKKILVKRAARKQRTTKQD
jgi:uncharacterized protein with PhoU and TrkA domain